MPDVVRLRNQYGHPVEVDHVNAAPGHGDVVEVPGRLVVDEVEYRTLMGLPTDPRDRAHVPLGPDVAGYHHILTADGQLRGWPKDKWDLDDAPSTSDTEE